MMWGYMGSCCGNDVVVGQLRYYTDQSIDLVEMTEDLTTVEATESIDLIEYPESIWLSETDEVETSDGTGDITLTEEQDGICGH